MAKKCVFHTILVTGVIDTRKLPCTGEIGCLEELFMLLMLIELPNLTNETKAEHHEIVIKR